MQMPERKIAGSAALERRAEGRFAGKDVLIDLLSSPGQAHERASQIIKETMIQLVQGIRIRKAYEGAAFGLAKEIYEAKKEWKTEKPTPMLVERPNIGNLSDALIATLTKMGRNATIVNETTRGNISEFTLVCDGEKRRILLKPSIMDAPDPLAEIEKTAKIYSFGLDNQHEKHLRERRETRPSCAPLGIREEDLDGIKTHYDGEVGQTGYSQFTYTVKELDTTTWVKPDLQGKALLDHLDRWLYNLHIDFKKPFDESVLEAISHSRVSAFEGVPEKELKGIAKALLAISSDQKIDESIVPANYREGVRRLRSSQHHADYISIKEGILAPEEVKAFKLAMDIFEKQESFTDDAVRNISDAHSLLLGEFASYSRAD